MDGPESGLLFPTILRVRWSDGLTPRCGSLFGMSDEGPLPDVLEFRGLRSNASVPRSQIPQRVLPTLNHTECNSTLRRETPEDRQVSIPLKISQDQ